MVSRAMLLAFFHDGFLLSSFNMYIWIRIYIYRSVLYIVECESLYYAWGLGDTISWQAHGWACGISSCDSHREKQMSHKGNTVPPSFSAGGRAFHNATI